MSKELQKLSNFKYKLAIAETIEDIKQIDNQAAALAEFVKRDGIGLEKQNELGIFRIEIEEKKGGWLEKNYPYGSIPGESGKLRGNEAEPRKMPVSKKESSRARKIKNADKKEKEEIINDIIESKDVVTPVKMENGLKQKEKAKRREKENKKRKSIIANIEIRKGDFKDVLDDVINIDAIITDPPYPKEYLQCFSDLSLYASTHLKDDGFIAVYSGQYHLPEVINRLSEHLTYVWTFCLYHVGKKQLVNGVNIMCGWKPVLIFSKGKKKMRFSAYDILTSEAMEKSNHEWQQSESGVKSLIEIFSEPGQLVVDPFSGSGTFLKVAQEMGRQAIGAEIE